jgi:hypothetical protein
VFHGDADSNWQRSLHFFLVQVAPTLNDDEHVVDSNAQQQKRQYGMHGSVEDPERRAKAVADQDGHSNRSYSS